LSILTLSRRARTAASVAALTGALGAAALAGPLSTPASAKPLSTQVFSYADMPDLDQKRTMGLDPAGVNHAGLPGNGEMYCGPTAAVDALGFLAAHGMASMAPGRRDWSRTSNYETGTSNIARMGTLMSTDAAKGTTQGNFEAGLTAWNNQTGRNFGFVSVFGGGDDWRAPNLGIAALSMAAGNPVIVRIGYYRAVVRTVSGRTMAVMERTGGHWVTMTGYGDEGLSFVDPADTTNTFAPSTRAHVVQAVTPVTGVFGYVDGAGAQQLYQGPLDDGRGNVEFPTETFLRMPGYAGGTAYVEGFTAVQPSFKLTAMRGFITIVDAVREQSFKLPITGKVADAQLSPAGDAAYYSLEGRRTVYKVNLATGVSRPLTTAPAAVTSLAVATSGDRVYAAAGKSVSAVTNTGTTVATTTLPSQVSAVAYDRQTGNVDAVSPKTGQITVLQPDLETQATVQLPETAIQSATGPVTAEIDPVRSTLEITAPGADSVVLSSSAINAVQPAPAEVERPLAVELEPVTQATLSSVRPSGMRGVVRSAPDEAAPIVRRSQTIGTTGVNAQLGG
jgi:hypothetical protein